MGKTWQTSENQHIIYKMLFKEREVANFRIHRWSREIFNDLVNKRRTCHVVEV
jgi:hypothetical protein